MDKSLSDCVFFTASSCIKGNNCEFRHVRTSPVICKFWMKDQCSNSLCSFKHPAKLPQISDEQRKQTPCYWLTQPGGCKKGSSCPYLHPDSQRPEEDGKTSETLSQKSKEQQQTEIDKLLTDSLSSSSSTLPPNKISGKNSPPRKAISPPKKESISNGHKPLLAAATPIVNQTNGKSHRILSSQSQKQKQTPTPTQTPIQSSSASSSSVLSGRRLSQTTTGTSTPDFGVKPLKEILKISPTSNHNSLPTNTLPTNSPFSSSAQQRPSLQQSPDSSKKRALELSPEDKQQEELPQKKLALSPPPNVLTRSPPTSANHDLITHLVHETDDDDSDIEFE